MVEIQVARKESKGCFAAGTRGGVWLANRYFALLCSRGDKRGEELLMALLRDPVDALDIAVGQSSRIAAGVVATERGLQGSLADA